MIKPSAAWLFDSSRTRTSRRVLSGSLYGWRGPVSMFTFSRKATRGGIYTGNNKTRTPHASLNTPPWVDAKD